MSRILAAFGMDDEGESRTNDQQLPPLKPTDVVFVPAHPRYPADADAKPQVGFELLHGPGRVPVPVVFTSLEKLVEALGEAQPWIAVRAGWYVAVMARSGFRRTRLDPTLPPGTRTWSQEALAEYSEAMQ